MPSSLHTIRVHLTDDSFYEVTYYCDDARLPDKEKASKTQLFIQHDDCICINSIDKSVCNNPHELEDFVHNKVIQSKGHLC